MDFSESFNLKMAGLLSLAGLVGAIDNLVGITAVIKAPNPGYSLAVSSVSILVVIFVSGVFSRSSLERRLVLASIIIVSGVIAIRLGS